MRLWERRAALLNGGAKAIDGSFEIAFFKQHAAQFELRIGIAAVSLIERAAQGGGGRIQIAASRQGDAEVMPGFRKLAVTLFDGVIERFDGFDQFAALE